MATSNLTLRERLRGAEMAAQMNADALRQMRDDRDEGKRHVRHLLDLIEQVGGEAIDPACEWCEAARKWSDGDV